MAGMALIQVCSHWQALATAQAPDLTRTWFPQRPAHPWSMLETPLRDDSPHWRLTRDGSTPGPWPAEHSFHRGCTTRSGNGTCRYIVYSWEDPPTHFHSHWPCRQPGRPRDDYGAPWLAQLGHDAWWTPCWSCRQCTRPSPASGWARGLSNHDGLPGPGVECCIRT